MGIARSVDDYVISDAVENENLLITNYWLEFVSARDVRESPTAKPRPQDELRARLQDFSQRMNLLLDNQERLRQAIGSGSMELNPEENPEFSTAGPRPDGRNGASAAAEYPDMSGPFVRGKQFVSNCLRDSFVLDVLEKLS